MIVNKKETEGLPENLIKIYSTDDEKLNEFGKLLTSDTSKRIFQLLFSETLTAMQISQKTDIELSLVRYHIKRMLELGIIKIAKIEKSIKAQDMKCYTATNLAVVILPPSALERAKESKMLVRSFKVIYKFVAIGVSAVSTWFGTQFMQNYYSDVGDAPPISKPQEEMGHEEVVPSFFDNMWLDGQSDILWSLIATILVISIGVSILIFKRRKMRLHNS